MGKAINDEIKKQLGKKGLINSSIKNTKKRNLHSGTIYSIHNNVKKGIYSYLNPPLFSLNLS